MSICVIIVLLSFLFCLILYNHVRITTLENKVYIVLQEMDLENRFSKIKNEKIMNDNTVAVQDNTDAINTATEEMK